jgi:D-amino-acid oxidase
VTEYFDSFDFYNEKTQAWYMKVNPYYRRVPADELPAGFTIGMTVTSVAVNPDIYLPWLQKTLEEKGVKFIRFTATTLDQVLAKTKAAVLVNASGLGAAKLCNDDLVTPIRGQALFVRNRPDWTNILLRQGSEYTYIIPRLGSGGIIIGGARQEGSLQEEADPALRKDILRRANRLSKGAFSHLDLENDVIDMVGFRPGRTGGFRLQIEGSNVVHAYGFDGSGYTGSIGAAKQVTQLVRQLTKKVAKL